MGKTIITLLNESVTRYGALPYLYEARNGTEYATLTYREVQEQVIRFAAGLMALGIEAGERIALISEGKTTGFLGSWVSCMPERSVCRCR